MNKSIYEFLENGDLTGITTYQAGAMQANTHRSLQKHSDTILKPYGITKMHWMIIGTILDSGKQGVRITELAKQLGTTLPYLTTTINLLESKNILMRVDHGTDSRAKLVVVQDSFKPICAEIEQTLRIALRASIYSHIDPQDFRTYMKVLYQLSTIE